MPDAFSPPQDDAVARLSAALARAEASVRERDAALALQTATQRQRLDERDAEILRLRAEVRLYRESTSWRITAPLRRAVALLRKLSRPRPAIPAAAPTGDAKAMLRVDLAEGLRRFLEGGERLRLPSGEPPEISILLVLHNQAELTFGCLMSLIACVADLRVQVIILDNASTDATAELLARIDGATILRSAENLHFLRGVNLAAREARGKALLLLNNDAQVRPGSIQAALGTLTSSDDIGAVGGRIILPDGTLQEAGSIVWQDGTCTGYARGASPEAPEAMFRRDVDFCSGAFLLTRRAVFERLGGFDEVFAPAYYEETDYCVRLWREGLRVVYEPDSAVLHYEFGSATDDAKALEQQRGNLSVFHARHRDWLREQLPNAPGNLLAARRARARIPRALMIEDRVPHARLGAGYPRANDFLRALAARADVTLFPMENFAETWASVRASVPAEVEVMLGRHAADLGAFLCERRGFYETIVVCRPHNMRRFVEVGGADAALRGTARIIYDAEAIEAAREILRQHCFGAALSPDDGKKLLADEMALARRADLVLSVSAAEQRVLVENGVQNVKILGHALATDPTPAPFEARTDILFVGAMHADWTPNADGLRWFAEEILPRIRRALGAPIRLKVVGENRVTAIAELDGVAFDLVGAVDDLRPHFYAARVVVAPTRFGAGIPHKVVQAAAHGVPVVATELLARQLGWVAGRDLLAAPDAEAFADACVRLLRDKALWEAVRESALARVREDCAPKKFAETVAGLLRR